MDTRKSEKLYHLDDIVFKVPIYYDEDSGKYFEEFPDFGETPAYTAEGYRCTTAMEDACSHGRAEGYPDCGSCGYYERAKEGDLIGICRCSKNRKSA